MRCWPLVQVALDEPPPGGESAILTAGAAHHIAPAKVGHRTPVGHRACKSLVDARVLILPHAEECRPHPQVMARLFKQHRVESTPRQGPRPFRPGLALLHLIDQLAAVQVGREHARLDLQQPDAEWRLQPWVAAAGPIHQRAEEKRVHARLGGSLAHIVGNMADGAGGGHALAQPREGRAETRGIRRAGRRHGLGGPAPDVLQFMHAGPQAVLAVTPSRRPRRLSHRQNLSREQGGCTER